jgi:methyltransferase (TIGR00027 family)
MRKDRTSRTAEIAAAVRAHHYLCVLPTIFEDPFALEFTSPLWRRIVETKPLRWFLFEVLLRSLHPVGAQIVARSRYAEDLLEEAIAAGISQYIIVGAGFDSFSLRRRDLEQTLRVFEIDHPDTQRAKRQRLLTVGVDLPKNVEYVGVDFERETVADGLSRSSYQPDSPAFFSWLGTTVYLSNSATLNTLASIARISTAGSEIVFDYGIPDELLSIQDKQVLEKLKRFTARRGEPLIGNFHPAELEMMIGAIGLELIENVSATDQEKRYFSNRHDGLRPMAASFFAHARVL